MPFAKNWGFEPVLADFWRDVLKQVPRTPLIGERFAAARRTLERRLGIAPLEVPMSRLCQTTPFVWFLHFICRDLERFHSIYNDAVQTYRRDHGIRSRNHPVPDLAMDGDWLETPFWAWRRGQTRRHKLFLRKTTSDWSLRFGSETLVGWPAGIDAPEMLKHFEQGLKIRPRALTTTMFARLFLADVFIHGIGGGIYDALTDRIIERFWNIEAPRYLIVSATLLLPLVRDSQAASRAKLLGRRLRDLQYQPERFVTPTGEIMMLVQSKKDWIGRDVAKHEDRLQRFEQIRAINARLQPHVAFEMDWTRAALVQCQHDAACNAIATRRDYAFGFLHAQSPGIAALILGLG
jgi:hypothetical protein